MLRHIIILFITLLASGSLVGAQNLLPTSLHAYFSDKASVESRGAKMETDLSTLLSWERQGYFAGDGNCTLSSEFRVQNPGLRYSLKVRLQCDVKKLYINGRLLAENLEKQYWNGKDEYAEFLISDKILRKGINSIKAECCNLGYTGGISHTLFSLSTVAGNNDEYVKIIIFSSDHVCHKGKLSARIQTSSSVKSDIHLHIENDFHRMCLDTVLHINRNDSLSEINLNNICKYPGFYQITATLHGKGYSGDAQWIAVEPELVECNNLAPVLFADYWKKTLKELSSVAPFFRIHKVDSLCRKSFRDVYIAEMQSMGNITIRGYYFVPRTGGRHHAVLQVPGYGWGFENIDGMLNDNADRAELALCVRGHGISADVFNPGFGVPGIWGYKLYEKDSMAYRAIYMDCVRAVEFLCSRPEIDSTKIAVKGGSQGGGLALATAALCSDKIAACAYFDPFPCDIRHQIRIRTTCETELKNDLTYYGSPCSFSEVMDNQDFTDTHFFASWIKCPILYTAALLDDDCPVHGGFTTYNMIESPKKYSVFPNDGHIEGFSHDAMIMKWIDDIIKE